MTQLAKVAIGSNVIIDIPALAAKLGTTEQGAATFALLLVAIDNNLTNFAAYIGGSGSTEQTLDDNLNNLYAALTSFSNTLAQYNIVIPASGGLNSMIAAVDNIYGATKFIAVPENFKTFTELTTSWSEIINTLLFTELPSTPADDFSAVSDIVVTLSDSANVHLI